MLNLNTTCYTVQNGVIVEGTLRDFEKFIEITPTPYGIQRKYFIQLATAEHLDDEIGGRYLDFSSPPAVIDNNVVWVLLYWQHGAENIVCTFDTEQEAQDELDIYYATQILHNNQICIHLDHNSAENELRNLLEDQTA
jgi:hypothetical protein